MIGVTLTLAAMLALIWWLTGPSRSRNDAEVSQLQFEVAEEALERAVGSNQALSDHDQGGTVLYDVLTSLGMAPDDAQGMVIRLGYPIRNPESFQAEPPLGLTVYSMKDDLARAALERALLVGIQLARMDDDYGAGADEDIDLENLRQCADDVETALFEDSRRLRLDFYIRAGLVLQDRIQAEPDSKRRRTMGRVMKQFDAEVADLEDELDQALEGLPEDADALTWGDSEDRRRYYFKMGVTNSLRRSGHMKSFGSLYRFRGVNYDVEEAFQLAGEEEPLLLWAANLEFDKLVALAPIDVRRLTNERRIGRTTPSIES